VALPPPGEGQAAILIQHTKAQHTGGQVTAIRDTVMDMTTGIPTNRLEYVPNRLKLKIRHPAQNQHGSSTVIFFRKSGGDSGNLGHPRSFKKIKQFLNAFQSQFPCGANETIHFAKGIPGTIPLHAPAAGDFQGSAGDEAGVI
jgi:hypothetical protein